MKSLIQKNKAFLERMYRRGEVKRHGFICLPELISGHEHPDYFFTTSEKPVENWVPQAVENYTRQCRMLEAVEDDGIPCARIATGTHIYAAAFGCDVNCYPDCPPCALPRVKNAAEADQLEKPDIWKSPTLYRLFEAADLLRKELGPDVFLGPPDMQSGFDTAALVWDKTDFMCAMADPEEKEAVKRLVGKCAALYREFLLAFRKEFPNCVPSHCPPVWCPPDMAPWLSNDECGAMSTEMFEEFCLPELIDLAETFGGLGMHCCANADHQLESFKKIPNFYAFNRVAPGQFYEPLLETYTDGDAPIFVLAWVSDEKMEKLIREANEHTRFIFVKTKTSVDDARAWLDRVAAVDSL